MIDVFIRRRKRGRRDTQEECHVTTEAKIGGMCIQVHENQVFLAITRN